MYSEHLTRLLKFCEWLSEKFLVNVMFVPDPDENYFEVNATTQSFLDNIISRPCQQLAKELDLEIRPYHSEETNKGYIYIVSQQGTDLVSLWLEANEIESPVSLDFLIDKLRKDLFSDVAQ